MVGVFGLGESYYCLVGGIIIGGGRYWEHEGVLAVCKGDVVVHRWAVKGTRV